MRLGVLSYVNTLPVTLGLELGEVPHPFVLVRGEPTWLNREARLGRLEVTAVSSVEVAAHPELYRVLPGLGLCARGPVQSVRLFSRLPLDELPGHPVAVTRASATSRLMLRVLVPGVRPLTLEGEPHLDPLRPLAAEGQPQAGPARSLAWKHPGPAGSPSPQGHPDPVAAALLIGDRALGCVPGARFIYDLGELWRERTGLPAVFALWVVTRSALARSPETFEGAAAALEASRRWGEENHRRVVDEASRRTGLPPERMESYYRALDYRLDEEAAEGLRELFRRAAALGLLPRGSEHLVAEAAA
jgi:chorismate dehydratase